MSYLDKVVAANRYDLDGFVPFTVAGETLGWVHADFAARLRGCAGAFVVTTSSVRLIDALDDRDCPPAERTAAIDTEMRALAARGELTGWREEVYPVARRRGESPVFHIERAAVAAFGFPGGGVHMNGFVRDDDGGLRMWVARRSTSKPTWPGMLDQLVAGGQPAGISIVDNLVKECWEEAAVPQWLARRAVPVGALTYVHGGVPGVIRPDTVYCYDLALPADFVPRANDGEVEAFELLPIDTVASIVRDSEAFKFNCALVVIDFLVRHGVIGPDDPDYVGIVEGLRNGAAPTDLANPRAIPR